VLADSGGTAWIGATTWLLVMMSPSEVRTTPEPTSVPPPTLICSVTTLGNTLAATRSTDGDSKELTAECDVGEAETNDCPPVLGGRTSTVTATPIAAQNIMTATPRIMNFPTLASLCRRAITKFAHWEESGASCRPAH
jgi:hypothetical protein